VCQGHGREADDTRDVHDEQLIKQAAADFAVPDQTTPTSTGAGSRHTIQQNDDFWTVGKQRMRRRNACKVCSIKFRRKGQKSNETSWFCVQCSEDNKRLFICNQIRASQGNTKTCFDIWHQDWRCRIPANASSTIQMRPTGKKRKRARRSLLQESKSDDEGDNEGNLSDDFE
jgi:hypothetical protein